MPPLRLLTFPGSGIVETMEFKPESASRITIQLLSFTKTSHVDGEPLANAEDRLDLGRLGQ
jgi:uncharacterized protein involved in propanediol utilization